MIKDLDKESAKGNRTLAWFWSCTTLAFIAFATVFLFLSATRDRTVRSDGLLQFAPAICLAFSILSNGLATAIWQIVRLERRINDLQATIVAGASARMLGPMGGSAADGEKGAKDVRAL